MFKVIRAFHDLQDRIEVKGGFIYQEYLPGDLYPRKGFSPSSERIAELAGSDNAQGTPLIVALANPAPAGKDAAEQADTPVAEEATEKPAKKAPAKRKARKKAADQELMPGA